MGMVCSSEVRAAAAIAEDVGSIPYHAHNFLIRFAIGVRTTIEHVFIQKRWGYSVSCHVVLFLYY